MKANYHIGSSQINSFASFIVTAVDLDFIIEIEQNWINWIQEINF
mgnify:CR=1 FL=1